MSSTTQAGVPIGGVLASVSLPALIALVDWRLALGPSSFARVADALDSLAKSFAVYSLFGFVGAAAAFRLFYTGRAV